MKVRLFMQKAVKLVEFITAIYSLSSENVIAQQFSVWKRSYVGAML
jgi:hypothetical protein